MTHKKQLTNEAKAQEPSKINVLQEANNAVNKESQSRTTSPSNFPIVGIGASAGGLAAFEAFFSGMPTDIDPDMAFILVQHLAPDHKSLLTELIQHCTRMPVIEVEDGMTVKPNCVYIIPPNCDMAFINGTLQLLEPTAHRGLRLPIDFFFRSLAQDQRERAIGIVLSGTGSDGALGVRVIKGEGGIVMAQKPESTEFDAMPRNAIATGTVDFELPPAEMPAQLIAYAKLAYDKSFQTTTVSKDKSENSLQKIFILVRAQTGHDFSQYKLNTINRRIERRMAVNQINMLDNYVKYLQQNPTEVHALFRDLLIGVTNFFRDPDSFLALKQEIIPLLFVDKQPGSSIRVWIPGCSTGEEAYSIAMLLQEQIDMLNTSYTVQIFATDIDSQSIATARAGLYPSSIAIDVSPDRLKHFFKTEADGSAYRINKNIRDMMIFSEQNVIKDPPFSKIDFISCRNLLIYMGKGLQEKLMQLFHYALNPDGIMFLGSSESIGDLNDLFVVLNRKAKLYQRKENFHGNQRANLARFSLLMDTNFARSTDKKTAPVKLPLRELTEQALLLQIAPAGALVNQLGDILYLHGRTGMYLEPTAGESGLNNILKMARDGLRIGLTTSLFKAVSTRNIVHCHGLRVKTNNHIAVINLTIKPIILNHPLPSDEPFYLVILEEDAGQAGQAGQAGGDPRIEALEQAFLAKEEHLLTTNEELSTANEELKSTNEELQSNIEELQSTNEELETAKEELQSINEELSTVNTEQQLKVIDLSRINNDMINLMAGTGIGTVFVDLNMRVVRFTSAASEIINLILSDIGRPVSHIAYNLQNYYRLVTDIQEVLSTLIPKETDVQSLAGKWYTMRILPYRTLENIIDGAVITFVDITETMRTREALENANQMLRLAVVVRDANDAITMQDLNGRILAWNPGAVRMYGWSENEALQMNVRDRIPEALREDELAKVHQLSLAEIMKPYCTQRLTREGTILEVWMTATALRNETGEMYAIATNERTKEAMFNLINKPNNAQHD
ncbi:MAG: chemotaxis protein CheB [Methylococcaceae bacterium]